MPVDQGGKNKPAPSRHGHMDNLPPILVYVSADWGSHWGYDLDFDPWPFSHLVHGPKGKLGVEQNEPNEPPEDCLLPSLPPVAMFFSTLRVSIVFGQAGSFKGPRVCIGEVMTLRVVDFGNLLITVVPMIAVSPGQRRKCPPEHPRGGQE